MKPSRRSIPAVFAAIEAEDCEAAGAAAVFGGCCDVEAQAATKNTANDEAGRVNLIVCGDWERGDYPTVTGVAQVCGAGSGRGFPLSVAMRR